MIRRWWARFALPTYGLRRHCERSEAIHSAASEDVDCFVAVAPLRKRFAFVAGNDGRASYPLPSLAAGRQTSSRFSTSVTPMSIRMTKADSTNMPANTAATSNTPSACWIR